MAGLFKPTYKDKKSGQVRETAKWYGWLTTPGGRKLRRPLATDKSVAQAMLAQWIKEVEMEHAGLKDPFADHRRRPLAEHLSAWESYLFSKARPIPKAQDQVRTTVFRVRSVFDACGFKTLADVSASRFAEHIAGLRTNAPPSANRKQLRQLSLQTLNFYLKACKQFFRFLVKDRRTPGNPLGHLTTYNVKLDRRHDRRVLDTREIAWLLETTRTSNRVYRGLTGEDRYLLYTTALGTGLRASELASLLVENFRLDSRPPFVRLLVGYAKNQTQVDQPLSSDLVDLLRGYLAGKAPRRPVWAGTWQERSARMFRQDLEAAREGWLTEAAGDPSERSRREASSFLVFRDEAGLVADFHALRHTFITLLERSGVSPKMAQSLARHAEVNLTLSRYTHVGLHDLAAALAALPPLSPPKEERQRHPLLAAAYQLFRHAQPLKRAVIEARLLAREDDDTIAHKCNVRPSVVAVYHDLFFAVRPNLQAEVYIVNMAIGPRAHGPLTFDDREILLKLIGYQMGGVMIDKVIDCFADPPICPADLTQLDDQALEKLRDKLRVQEMLLLATLPAGAAATEQFQSIRQLLAQAGTLGHETASDVNKPLSVIESALDCRDSLSEPEASAHNSEAPFQAEVAADWRAVPA